MILTSREPFDIPGIKSLVQLCQGIGLTEVIVATTKTDKPTREYNGTLFVERIVIDSSYLLSSKIRIGLFVMYRLLKRAFTKPQKMVSGRAEKPSSLFRSLSRLAFWKALTDALYQRVRATPIIPRLIICYGLNTVVAGVRMKRLYGCPVIYDDQDYFLVKEEAQSYFSNLFKTITEHRSFRFVDVAIASSPMMARSLQSRYGIRCVLAIGDGPSVDKDYQRIIESFCGKKDQE